MTLPTTFVLAQAAPGAAANGGISMIIMMIVLFGLM